MVASVVVLAIVSVVPTHLAVWPVVFEYLPIGAWRHYVQLCVGPLYTSTSVLVRLSVRFVGLQLLFSFWDRNCSVSGSFALLHLLAVLFRCQFCAVFFFCKIGVNFVFHHWLWCLVALDIAEFYF